MLCCVVRSASISMEKINGCLKNTGALALMLKELYDFDLDALTADIAKIELLEADKVVDKRDRKKLLRAFWWIISVYYEGNVKKAIQTCNDIKAFK